MKIHILSFFWLLCLNLAFCFQTFADTEKKASEQAQAAKEKIIKPKKSKEDHPPYPNVHFKTNMGDIYFSLNGMRAPITVKNFLEYVENGHYEGTIFHRVIPGFVAQGGGYKEDYSEQKTAEPIINESGNGLSNIRGSLAMARTNDPHTARSQFYINLVDNTKLDPRPDRWGYTVFGEVSYGMNLLDKISKMPTGAGGVFKKDVPIKPLIVESARIMAIDEEIPIEPVVFEDEETAGEEPTAEETTTGETATEETETKKTSKSN